MTLGLLGRPFFKSFLGKKPVVEKDTGLKEGEWI